MTFSPPGRPKIWQCRFPFPTASLGQLLSPGQSVRPIPICLPNDFPSSSSTPSSLCFLHLSPSHPLILSSSSLHLRWQLLSETVTPDPHLFEEDSVNSTTPGLLHCPSLDPSTSCGSPNCGVRLWSYQINLRSTATLAHIHSRPLSSAIVNFCSVVCPTVA